MSTIRPCGSCVRAEYPDEDSDGLNYIAKPGARTAHVKRPSGSSGQRGVFQEMAWLARGDYPFTYCGQEIGDDWIAVDPHE